WSVERPLPQSEREFRSLFWQDMVRADHQSMGGMARRREAAFVQVALRRARTLTMYTDCRDLDTEVIDSLQRDSLIVPSPESRMHLAVAHDVLEDWAILQWIDEQNVSHEGSIQELLTTVGAYPAIRRTYRKWVIELLERNPEAANRLFQVTVDSEELP